MVDLSRQILYTVLALTVLLTGQGVVCVRRGDDLRDGVRRGRLRGGGTRALSGPAHLAATGPSRGAPAACGVQRLGVHHADQWGDLVADGHDHPRRCSSASACWPGYSFAARLQSAVSYPLSLTAAAVVPAAANLLALQDPRVAAARAADPRHAIHARALPAGDDRGDDPGPAAARRHGSGAQYARLFRPRAAVSHIPVTVTARPISPLTMLDRHRADAAVTAYVTIAVAVNLILSIALAKPLGVSGVIIGTLVGYGISGPLYIRLVLQELSMELRAISSAAPSFPSCRGPRSSPASIGLDRYPRQPQGLLAVALCCIPAASCTSPVSCASR